MLTAIQGFFTLLVVASVASSELVGKEELVSLPGWFGNTVTAAPSDEGDIAATAPEDLPPSSVPSVPEVPLSTTKPSVLNSIGDSIIHQLHSKHNQGLNACVALAFGIVLLANGQFFFKWLVVAGVFLATMLMALNEVTAIWDLGYESPVRNFIGFEVGACSAYMALLGFDGVMLILGAMLGMVCAQGTERLVSGVGYHMVFDDKRVVVALYSFFILGAIVAIAYKKHQKLLGVLSSFLGGGLVASCVSWLITLQASKGHLDWLNGVFTELNAPTTGAWVDFLMSLCDSKAKDVGIFATSDYAPFQLFHAVLSIDVVCGWLLWLVFFLIGVKFQSWQITRAKAGKYSFAEA